MRYYKYLYKSDTIRNVNRLKSALNSRKGLIGYHCVIIDPESHRLEIINSFYLRFKYYRRNKTVIVGIFKSFDEAKDIIIDLFDESIKKTGKADILDYLILRTKTDNFTHEV